MAASPALVGPMRLFSGVERGNLQQWGWSSAPCPTCTEYWASRFQNFYEDPQNRPADMNDTVAERMDQELVKEAAASHRMPRNQTGAMFNFFNVSGGKKEVVSWSVSPAIATNFIYSGEGGQGTSVSEPERMADGALIVGKFFCSKLVSHLADAPVASVCSWFRHTKNEHLQSKVNGQNIHTTIQIHHENYITAAQHLPPMISRASISITNHLLDPGHPCG